MPMLLFKHVDGFEVSKEALFIPRVAGIVDFFVGPLIGEEDFSGISADVCERIQNVPGASRYPTAYWRRRLRLT